MAGKAEKGGWPEQEVTGHLGSAFRWPRVIRSPAVKLWFQCLPQMLDFLQISTANPSRGPALQSSKKPVGDLSYSNYSIYKNCGMHLQVIPAGDKVTGIAAHTVVEAPHKSQSRQDVAGQELTV